MKTEKFHIKHLSLPTLTHLLQAICREIREIRKNTGSGPLNSEQQQMAKFVRNLTFEITLKYDTESDTEIKARGALALMDAYEILGEEPLLQFTLTQSELLLQNLNDTPLKCKLLCYCYHYTEDTECAEEALQILNNWPLAPNTPEIIEARKCYNELI